MGVDVHFTWPENKSPAELERILSQSVLAMSPGRRALSGREIFALQHVQEIAALQFGCRIGLAVSIYEKRKRDARVAPELLSILPIAKADNGYGHIPGAEFILVCAQLRDVLAAKDSAVVTQERDDATLRCPERT